MGQASGSQDWSPAVKNLPVATFSVNPHHPSAHRASIAPGSRLRHVRCQTFRGPRARNDQAFKCLISADVAHPALLKDNHRHKKAAGRNAWVQGDRPTNAGWVSHFLLLGKVRP